MPITLTQSQIEAALSVVKEGLDQYLWLQTHLHAGDVRFNPEYMRRFNRFYRVRRNHEWQRKFYDLLERFKGNSVEFAEVLSALHAATGRYEASFSSKLLATVNPEMPVIDSVVLRNLGLRLPPAYATDRANRIQRLHADMLSAFRAFLATMSGKALVARFRRKYPDAKITTIKMLDLVLWQTRPTKTR